MTLATHGYHWSTPQRGGEYLEARRNEIREIRQKRALWRQISLFGVLTAAFWISWVIGGVREEWVLPWPLVPTILWGAFLLYRTHALGGTDAVSHAEIERQVEHVRHPEGPIYVDHIRRRPIQFGYTAAYSALPPFHLQDVIDAREPRPEVQAADASQTEALSG